MAELHHFTAHVKRLVAPALKAHGFKLKGTRFLRSSDGFSDEICIQRSQRNKAGADCRFYVNVYTDIELSAEEREAVSAPIAARHWCYVTEADLCEQLSLAAGEILTVGFDYLKRVHYLMAAGYTPRELRAFVRAEADRLQKWPPP